MSTKNARITAAERVIARAEAEIAKILSRPDEPITDEDGAVVLWFRRRFDRTSQMYTYGAVKAGNRWYLTGSAAPQALTWDKFLDWLDDDLVGTLWVSSNEGWVALMEGDA
jgi:hypothetical protein